jgi:hypothetical protein
LDITGAGTVDITADVDITGDVDITSAGTFTLTNSGVNLSIGTINQFVSSTYAEFRFSNSGLSQAIRIDSFTGGQSEIKIVGKDATLGNEILYLCGSGLNVAPGFEENMAALHIQAEIVTFYSSQINIPRGDVDITGDVEVTGNTQLTGTFDIDGDADITGFTALGTGSPTIKMKKVTGTTSDAEGGNAGVAHGLDVSKIISLNVLVVTETGNRVPHGFVGVNGYEFSISCTDTNVMVYNHATNSENILTKTFIATIIYEA